MTLGGACSCVKLGDRYGLVMNLGMICWLGDLYNWSEPEPLHFDFESSKAVYETVTKPEENRYGSGHRDPNIIWDPETGTFVMFFLRHCLVW